MTDGQIIDLFLERDESAISSCNLKYGKPLRSFGNRITNDAWSTEECVNDTYLTTWQTIPPNEPRGYLFAYLSKILRHKCIDKIKHLTRMKRDNSLTVLTGELNEAVPASNSADSDALRNELSSLISRFVSSLKSETAEIFLRRYFYMEEIRSISLKMGISEGKVKTVLKRTRDSLKTYLEKYGYNT